MHLLGLGNRWYTGKSEFNETRSHRGRWVDRGIERTENVTIPWFSREDGMNKSRTFPSVIMSKRGNYWTDDTTSLRTLCAAPLLIGEENWDC